MIHEVAPDVRIYSSTWRHTADWDNSLDIWGAGAYGCFPTDEMARLRKAGKTLWFTTDAQLLLDTPYCAVERMNPYYCFAHGAQGYEFWAIGWWTYENYNPLRYGWYTYYPHTFTPTGATTMIRYPNGSGHLAYPGWLAGEDGPLSSIRLEAVRDGMEDYEYMALLRDRITAARAKGRYISGAEAALAEVSRLAAIPNGGGTYSTRILPDPGAIGRIRARLAREIIKLSEQGG